MDDSTAKSGIGPAAIWVVIVVIVLLGVVWYFFGRGGASAPATEPTATTSIPATAAVTSPAPVVQKSTTSSGVFRGTIQALVERGGNYLCAFTQSGSAGTTSGTVYVSGIRLRGDFTDILPGGGSVESHMLYTGGYIFTWTTLSTDGFQAKASLQTAGGALPFPDSRVFNYRQVLDYRCSAWGGDSTKFEVPKGISFTVLN